MTHDISAYTTTPVGPEEAGRIRLLQGSEYDSIRTLLETCPGLELEPNRVLVAPGEPCQVLYIVLSGRLRIHLASPTSNPIGTVEAGESLGELSIASRKSASSYAIADKKSRVLVLDEDRLLEFINCSHVLARNYIFSLIHHLRSPDQTMVQVADMQDKFQRYSHVDEITGLHNQRWIEEMLGRQIMRSATDKRPLSILMLDIDGFSEFQHEFGEVVGHQALYILAQTLMRKARPTDLIARYENDRFVLILPDTDMPGAQVLAQRLRVAVSETGIEIPNECILPPLTISVGIARMTAFVGAKKLLSDARVTLEVSKTSGGNRVSPNAEAPLPRQAEPDAALAAAGNH